MPHRTISSFSVAQVRMQRTNESNLLKAVFILCPKMIDRAHLKAHSTPSKSIDIAQNRRSRASEVAYLPTRSFSWT